MNIYKRIKNSFELRGNLKDFKTTMHQFEGVRNLNKPREILFQFIIFLTEVENFSRTVNIPMEEKYQNLLRALEDANGREKGYNVTEENGYLSAATIKMGDINGLELKTLVEWLKDGKESNLDTIAYVQAKPFILKNSLLITKEIEKIL